MIHLNIGIKGKTNNFLVRPPAISIRTACSLFVSQTRGVWGDSFCMHSNTNQCGNVETVENRKNDNISVGFLKYQIISEWLNKFDRQKNWVLGVQDRISAKSFQTQYMSSRCTSRLVETKKLKKWRTFFKIRPTLYHRHFWL